MELVRFPSRGGFSVRSIVTFVLTVVITALLWATFSSTAIHAAGEANWNGASLQYDGNQYISMGEAKSGDSIGLADGTSYYLYVAPSATTGSATSATQKAYVIYFAPGASPPSETSATYVEYTYNAAGKAYSNPTNTQAITINTASASSGSTSCAIEGIGWIACPAMTWLASGMDKVFNIIAGFMEVQPLQTGDTNSALYSTWNVMRSIANIAFIIVFLIIIYAQLTNIQVNNYGLKKLLPRLIIAAIAVNLSYFIAAIAVDLSNILGYSIEDMFMGLQQTVIHTGTVDPAAAASINSVGSWAGFTAFAVSGGTAAVVGVTSAVAATGGTAMGAVYILLPLLLGLLLALIVVFLILAARQALIVILIIIAPLALVAYLLPNTEKWFEKWRSLFMTMLIFFPAFAFVFGGAQLAGAIIIQNATSITMQLLGMVVQVAPLVIAPLLLKLSGNVLGNIAGVINKPNKGLVDRTRNWSKDRAEWHRKRGIGALDRKGNPIELTKRNALRKSARYLDQRTRRLGDRTTNAETASQTSYENSRLYTKPGKYDMAQQKAYFEHTKEATHSHHADHVDKARRTEGSLVYQAGIDARSSKQRADASHNYTEAFYNNAQRDQKLAGGVLHASGYKLELSKDKLTTTEGKLKAYYDEQRTTKGTDLHAMVKPLETSKLRVEAAQSTYTAMVEEMKIAPGTAINRATQNAQSAKEHVEAAQATLQTYFDRERKIEGSQLNQSMLKLEDAKVVASEAKDLTTVYLNEAKSRVDGVLHVQNARAEKAKLAAQNSESRVKSVLEEYKAGNIPNGASSELVTIIEELSAERQSLVLEQRRTDNAVKVQNDHMADALINDGALRDYAGGINEQGSDSALANAVNTVRAAYGQSVNEARQIIKHFNLSSGERQKLALLPDGGTITITRDDGTSHTFTSNDIYAREAAIEDQIATGTIDQVEAIVQVSGKNSQLAEYRTTIADALAKNSLGGKSLYLGGKTIDDVGKGRFNGPEDILAVAVETIAKGKVSEKDLASIDPIAVERLLEAAKLIKSGEIPAGVDPSLLPEISQRLVEFTQVAHDTLINEERGNIKTKAKPYIEEISQL